MVTHHAQARKNGPSAPTTCSGAPFLNHEPKGEVVLPEG